MLKSHVKSIINVSKVRLGTAGFTMQRACFRGRTLRWWNSRHVTSKRAPDSNTARRVTSTPTLRGPCSLQSPTTWCARWQHSDSSSRGPSSPRRSVGSSSRCPFSSRTVRDDASFICRATGPGPPSGVVASNDSSNYRPHRSTLEVTRGTPEDFQCEQVTRITVLVARHVCTAVERQWRCER